MRLFTTGNARKPGGAAILLVPLLLALTACADATSQWAESTVEARAREENRKYEAQGNPRFADPEKAEIVRRFEADFERFGRSASRVSSGARDRECRIDDPRRAYRLMNGEGFEERRARLAVSDITHAADLDSIRIRMVSGRCEMLETGGDVEFVASMRAVERYGTGGAAFLNLQRSVLRVRGPIRDGRRAGRFRTIEILRKTRMDPDETGEFKVTRRDWEHLNRIIEAPVAIYTYASFGPDGVTGPKLRFQRHPETHQYTTIVEEPRPDGTRSVTTYNGTELRSEHGLKNGLLHGWLRIHSHEQGGHTVPDMLLCYQNGIKVKSTTCPSI